ncbi:tyrosine phosphatase family-domain-containing protein [Spinellus fusiger]|nr:tyrosine phosphatase family-domain-containing protein [Spinellus fusiger]
MVKLPDLIPPFRYSLVEENVFRGGYPKPRNIRFLKRDADIFESQGIQVVHLTVDKMKEDTIPLGYNKTLMALQIIIDPSNHPLYLHCLDGADVTGLIVACLRKLQMWSMSSVLSEFSRHLHTNVVASEEYEFIDNFKNFEVTIPSSLPSWLWNGHVNFRKHPCLRLKFLNPTMMTEEERETRQLKEKKEKEKEDFYKKRKNDLLDNLFDTTNGPPRHRTTSPFGSLPVGGNTVVGGHLSPAATSPTKPFESAVMTGRIQPQTEIPLCTETIFRKDQYLVDVDVDVDGVMMDGLDQVDYYNHDFRTRFYNDKAGADVLEEEEIYEEEYPSEPISRILEALALEGLTD